MRPAAAEEGTWKETSTLCTAKAPEKEGKAAPAARINFSAEFLFSEAEAKTAVYTFPAMISANSPERISLLSSSTRLKRFPSLGVLK